MKADVVVDVGNSRIKWGRCLHQAVVESVSLPSEEAAWQKQLGRWNPKQPWNWAVSGVHPQRRDALVDWLKARGETVLVLASHQQLPLRIDVDQPEQVGIDRLLNAVAANPRRRPKVPAVVVDAGSAVTVDYLDEAGTFLGGAIFPGLRLMARALHEHTALLPLVEPDELTPMLPARNTMSAMQAGIHYAVAGGIEAIIRHLEPTTATSLDVFLTGGDALLVDPSLSWEIAYLPNLTLEGIRLAAEALP